MFIAEAIAGFSGAVMQASNHQQQKNEESDGNQGEDQQKIEDQQQEQQSDKPDASKRIRSKSQQKELEEHGKSEQTKKQDDNAQKKQNEQIQYATFEKGEKIVVKETFENGWWFGHPVKKTDQQGFFPSNYVRVGAPPPPPPPKKKEKQEKEEQMAFDPEQGHDWIKEELDKVKTGPVKSDYYQSIKGYKLVKVKEGNQSILKGNNVQYDVNTGLAKIPIKDQAPAAKAVRQMGYYFDYHQWNEQKNTNPAPKARPDPKKKKAKKLNLKMMDY